MDHILQLHVEHHSGGGGLELCDPGGAARFGKGGDAPRAVVALAAFIASLALLLLPSFLSAVTARTALFVLSNAILLLLAADCRWFFSAAAGEVPDNSGGGGAASETSTEPVTAIPSSSTTALEALEEASRSELLRRLDRGDSVAVETALVDDEQEEPCCDTGQQGLEELGIDELNRKFDEFIQSRRNRWITEESLLAV
ncbi:unnamed protein product [Urochloa humidicola]